MESERPRNRGGCLRAARQMSLVIIDIEFQVEEQLFHVNYDLRRYHETAVRLKECLHTHLKPTGLRHQVRFNPGPGEGWEVYSFGAKRKGCIQGWYARTTNQYCRLRYPRLGAFEVSMRCPRGFDPYQQLPPWLSIWSKLTAHRWPDPEGLAAQVAQLLVASREFRDVAVLLQQFRMKRGQRPATSQQWSEPEPRLADVQRLKGRRPASAPQRRFTDLGVVALAASHFHCSQVATHAAVLSRATRARPGCCMAVATAEDELEVVRCHRSAQAHVYVEEQQLEKQEQQLEKMKGAARPREAAATGSSCLAPTQDPPPVSSAQGSAPAPSSSRGPAADTPRGSPSGSARHSDPGSTPRGRSGSRGASRSSSRLDCSRRSHWSSCSRSSRSSGRGSRRSRRTYSSDHPGSRATSPERSHSSASSTLRSGGRG